ncbi:MAG: hypothetical protein EKK49_10180 [Rhodocyclaceae bacterium]|nr:MAG: hypothetical protein EKK49_10180 [Rhodocyclaceae bacterium]
MLELCHLAVAAASLAGSALLLGKGQAGGEDDRCREALLVAGQHDGVACPVEQAELADAVPVQAVGLGVVLEAAGNGIPQALSSTIAQIGKIERPIGQAADAGLVFGSTGFSGAVAVQIGARQVAEVGAGMAVVAVVGGEAEQRVFGHRQDMIGVDFPSQIAGG